MPPSSLDTSRHFTNTFLHDKFQGVYKTDTEYKNQKCSFSSELNKPKAIQTERTALYK